MTERKEPTRARPDDPEAHAPPPSRGSWTFVWGCLGLLVLIGIVIAVTQMGY